MRQLMIILLSVGFAVAQNAPVALTINPNDDSVVAENTSGKEIVMISLVLSGKDLPDWVSGHDWYFKQGGCAPGDLCEVAHGAGQRVDSAAIAYIQFADGSSFGDKPDNLALQLRAEYLTFYKNAGAAYRSGGEKGLSNYINTTTDSRIAKHYQRMEKNSGIGAVVSQVESHLAAANSRSF
jgi:hypothetical protein